MRVAVTCFIALLLSSTGFSARLGEKNAPAKGITFSGGGFRAHAVHTGFVAGLLGGVPVNSGQSKLTELFKSTEAIGSNSGGSWFMAQLAYSENFVEMVQAISAAKDLETAANKYYDRWISPFLAWQAQVMPPVPGGGPEPDAPLLTDNTASGKRKLKSANPSGLHGIQDILQSIWAAVLQYTPSLLQWSALLLQHTVLTSGLSWQEIVQAILEIPGDVDATKSLNEAPSNSWCAGKVWAISGAIVQIPPSGFQGALGSLHHKCDGETHSITYSGEAAVDPQRLSRNVGPSLPVAFSTRLGKTGEDAPLPFSYRPDGNTDVQLTYDLLGKNNKWYDLHFGEVVKTVQSTKVAPMLGNKTNRASLVNAVATSSAFLGQIATATPLLAKLAVMAVSDTEWERESYTIINSFLNTAIFLNAGDPDAKSAFVKGNEAMDPTEGQACSAWLAETAEARIVSLADGGYVDNSGLANLISTAKDGDSFVLVINTNGPEVQDIMSLFRFGASSSTFPKFTHLPVFTEDAADVAAHIASFESTAIQANSQFLSSIRFGTIQATTMDQPYFGVKAGVRVNLHAVVIDSSTSLAEFEWKNFAYLAAEISMSLQMSSNSKIVAEMRGWLNP